MWVARLDTDGFDSPITCVEKTVYMNGNGVCQSARAGLFIWEAEISSFYK